MSNVVPISRRQERLTRSELGFFIHVGHNDHRTLLNLLASGERGMFGLVISAAHVDRHADLIADARNRGLDVILDPKTQEMATPGGFVGSITRVPWSTKDFHRVGNFQGVEGRERVQQIVEFAAQRNFTQLIGATHLLGGPNDPWLRSDVACMGWAHDAIVNARLQMPLIYSLALPIAVLRDRDLRLAMLAAILDVPCDAIWLKTENFGDDASGDKLAAYLEACRDFHAAGVPIVADHVGGMPGLASLAFGAVGGIAHGVTIHQNFKASAWRRPHRQGDSGFAANEKRVYIPRLDVMLSRDVTRQLLQSSTRARGHFACNDQSCCPRGMQDMLANAGRHAMFQRAREVERIAQTPLPIRAESFLEQTVRPVSDELARVAGFASLPDDVRLKFSKKQTQVGGFRAALTHLAEAPVPSVSVAPQRRFTL